MKDLYKRLNIECNASRAQIEFALEHCESDSLKDDAEHILLNAARKQVYDRNRATLELIGALRHKLRLDNTPHWDMMEYRDFTIDESIPVSRPAQQKQPQAPQKPGRPTVYIEEEPSFFFANPYARFWIVFGVVGLIYLLIYLMAYAE